MSENAAEGDIIFCGDTFCRSANGDDPFALILPALQGARVCLNFETALDSPTTSDKLINLTVPEIALNDLPVAAVYLNLVNNHTADGGDANAVATALLAREKVVIGPENPALVRTEVDGVSIDFISAYFNLPRWHASYQGNLAGRLVELVDTSDADRKIIMLHWGYEHVNLPAPFQRDLAHELVELGADIIIGHHPHVPQGWEIYRGVPIYYSLGNFNFWQFDTTTTPQNRLGYIVRFNLETNEGTVIPYTINENYQPVAADEEEQTELFARLNLLNESLIDLTWDRWYRECYQGWFSHEFKVWVATCRKGFSPQRWIKFLAWLVLPMQLRYYRFRLVSMFRREG